MPNFQRRLPAGRDICQCLDLASLGPVRPNLWRERPSCERFGLRLDESTLGRPQERAKVSRNFTRESETDHDGESTFFAGDGLIPSLSSYTQKKRVAVTRHAARIELMPSARSRRASASRASSVRRGGLHAPEPSARLPVLV